MKSSERRQALLLAVDIGGTKLAAASVSMNGEILTRMVEPTLQDGPQAGIQQIIRILEALAQSPAARGNPILGIGIGIPAVLEAETDFVIWGPNLQDWKQVDLRGPLETHFNLPVCVEYDGHTAVLGEWWMGSGSGCQSVVSVIIGTGVGGGMVLDGHLVRGINRLAGAVGWFALGPSVGGNLEKERSLGGWEAAIAGPGITRRAGLLKNSKSHLLTILGDNPSAADVFEAAMQGDPLAQQISSEEAVLIGIGLSNIVSLVNPQIIILGGSVGSNAGFLLPQVKEVVRAHAQPISAGSVEIVTSRLGTDAGLLGAAYGALLRLKHPEISNP